MTQISIQTESGSAKRLTFSGRLTKSYAISFLRSTSFSNICVFHGYHPRAWKRACSYMPISLLCGLSKVFEAIITKRLMSWAETTDKLPTVQSGFRKHHSTNDKLFELTQAVSQAQRLSRRVGAIFLDIEKAFDRVGHNGLRHELLHMNAPRSAAQMDFSSL